MKNCLPKIHIITMMRKGSGRLANKNILPLGNKPLYMWTVEDALKIGYPYYVYHNYDNLKLPSQVIEQKYIGTGLSMDILKKHDADIFVMMPATSPIRDSRALKPIIEKFIKQKAEVLISLTSARKGMYYNSKLKPLNIEYKGHKRDTRIVLRESGTLYIFTKKQLYKKCFLKSSKKKTVYFYDKIGIDIDTEADYEQAKDWFRRRHGGIDAPACN